MHTPNYKTTGGGVHIPPDTFDDGPRWFDCKAAAVKRLKSRGLGVEVRLRPRASQGHRAQPSEPEARRSLAALEPSVGWFHKNKLHISTLTTLSDAPVLLWCACWLCWRSFWGSLAPSEVHFEKNKSDAWSVISRWPIWRREISIDRRSSVHNSTAFSRLVCVFHALFAARLPAQRRVPPWSRAPHACGVTASQNRGAP